MNNTRTFSGNSPLSGPRSRFFLSFLMAFLASWAIQIVTGSSVRNFLLLPVFILLWLFFWYLPWSRSGAFVQAAPGTLDRPSGKTHPFWFALAALLLSLSFLLAQHAQYTAAYSSTLFRAGALLMVFLGLLVLFLGLLVWLDRCLVHGSRAAAFFTKQKPSSGSASQAVSASLPLFLYRHASLLTFLLCLLFYLPYFLYEFPAILSPDGAWQAEQAIGVRPWSNHHPVAHSVVIWFFYHLGRLFTSDVNVALSFYTAAQLIFMAFCAAMAVHTLKKLKFAGWVLALAAAFYALVPFNGVFSVMVGKDTVFSGVTLLLLCSLLQLIRDAAAASGFSSKASGSAGAQAGTSVNAAGTDAAAVSGRKAMIARTALPIRHVVFFLVSAILFCLFRTNGWYAFLFMTPFLFVGLRRIWRPLLCMLAIIVLTAGLIRGPVMDAAGVEKNDFVESICVPLQQVGRVAVADQQDGSAVITQEQRALIARVCHYEDIPKIYDPKFADMMKELIRTNGDQQYLTEHKRDFLKLWLDLGRQNPGLYLQAWVDVTEGYWFPDYDYETATIDGVFSNVAGLSWQPLIGGPVVVKVKEIFLKLGDVVPIYGLLFSSGTYSFLLLLAGALILHSGQKRRSLFLVLLPCDALLFTLFLAAPISAEFRYTYPLTWTFPLWIVMPLLAAQDPARE